MSTGPMPIPMPPGPMGSMPKRSSANRFLYILSVPRLLALGTWGYTLAALIRAIGPMFQGMNDLEIFLWCLGALFIINAAQVMIHHPIVHVLHIIEFAVLFYLLWGFFQNFHTTPLAIEMYKLPLLSSTQPYPAILDVFMCGLLAAIANILPNEFWKAG